MTPKIPKGNRDFDRWLMDERRCYICLKKLSTEEVELWTDRRGISFYTCKAGPCHEVPPRERAYMGPKGRMRLRPPEEWKRLMRAHRPEPIP